MNPLATLGQRIGSLDEYAQRHVMSYYLDDCPTKRASQVEFEALGKALGLMEHEHYKVSEEVDKEWGYDAKAAWGADHKTQNRMAGQCVLNNLLHNSADGTSRREMYNNIYCAGSGGLKGLRERIKEDKDRIKEERIRANAKAVSWWGSVYNSLFGEDENETHGKQKQRRKKAKRFKPY